MQDFSNILSQSVQSNNGTLLVMFLIGFILATFIFYPRNQGLHRNENQEFLRDHYGRG